MADLFQIDESTLDPIDRLGLAYCRMNSWEWDEVAGPKPEGFDGLPLFDRRMFKRFRKKIVTKHDYIRPAISAIESIVGEANASRCWWKFVLDRSEEDWFRWYLSQDRTLN